MKSEPKGQRLLESLLRLYPRRFLEQYGDEMRELVRHRYRRDTDRSRISIGPFIGAAAGLLWNAVLVWADCAFRTRGLALEGRFVQRSIRRAPAFGTTVCLVIAVAVAMTASAAGFLRGTIYRSRPADSERLVFVWGSNVRNGQLRDVVSGPNFLDLRRASRSVPELAAIHPGSAVASEEGRPQLLDTLDVTVDFLRVLGTVPVLGREFGEEHRSSGGPAAVVVSHAFWRDHLGGRPEAVGSKIALDGIPHDVLGVLHRDFEFLIPAPILRPLHENVLAGEDRTFYNYWLIGRLAPGVTTGEATSELSSILTRLAREDPRLSGFSVLVERVDRISVAAVRPLLLAIGGAVLLVLLAAGGNVASLNLVRTLGRSREIRVRTAMGAGRAELVRLVLLETGMLVAAGAMVGIAGGIALLSALARIIPPAIPIPGSAATVSALAAVFDAPVLLSALAAAGVSWGLLVLPAVGTMGAWARPRPGWRDARIAAPPRGWKLLVAVELALATVLLVGAGLLSTTVDHLRAVDPGVDPVGLLTFYVGELDDFDSAARTRYYREVVRRIEDVPGVIRAGAIDYVPFQGEDDFMGFRLEDRPPPLPGQGPREEWRRVSENYFEAAGLTLLSGRGFESRDLEVPPAVAVVNEAFVRKYWPGGDALGRRMRIALPEYGAADIVGIVEDVPERGPAFPAPPMFFVPLHGQPRDNMALFVRLAGDPLASIEALEEAVWSIDSTQPIDRVFLMSSLLAETLFLPRLAERFLACFAGIALSLATIGLFGVASYAIRARRSELGIRLALGATPGRLKRDLLGELTPLVLAGLTAGVGLGAGAGFLARTLLYGVSPEDPRTMGAAACVAALAALVGTYCPARSVARIDPAESVREPT